MKAIRVLFVGIMASTLLLIGCPLDQKDKRDRTSAGWAINWVDQGTITSGRHSLGDIHDLFDAAMVRSCDQVDTVYGFPPGTCRAKLGKDDPTFELRDHFYFPVEGVPVDVPNAQYASGETMNRFWVILAFYDKATANSTDPASVPATAPPWTVVLGPQTGNWYWGEEQLGNQFPALAYELHWFFSQDPNFP